MSAFTLSQANQLISTVFSIAGEKHMPPLAVAVLDSGAHLIALQRQDGVSFLRVDIAQAKAWGALALATNSDQIAARYDQDESQKGFINSLNAMTQGRIVPLPGGVLVRDKTGEIVAAVGAAGGDSKDDQFCVINSIEKNGFSV